MAFDARVFRILVASPSDVDAERQIAVSVIQDWNNLHSATRKIALLPLRWETHVSPEYGVRPQEAINRAIVDDCDMLLGIFWTRLGSPTGYAESGTLEEIERVAKAGKPVMLYFSKALIAPERIDIEQLSKLRDFQGNTYPRALVETYSSVVDFRDKFARHLEMKVRELQQEQQVGRPSLSLEFAASTTGDLEGSSISRALSVPVIKDAAEVIESASEQLKGMLWRHVKRFAEHAAIYPVVLAIHNAGAVGINNVFAEIQVFSVSSGVRIRTKWPFGSMPAVYESHFSFMTYDELGWWSQRRANVKMVPNGVKFSIEWSSLQPKRTRYISPALLVQADGDAEINFRATVYADSFPEPQQLIASLSLSVVPEEVTFSSILPELELSGEQQRQGAIHARVHDSVAAEAEWEEKGS